MDAQSGAISEADEGSETIGNLLGEAQGAVSGKLRSEQKAELEGKEDRAEYFTDGLLTHTARVKNS